MRFGLIDNDSQPTARLGWLMILVSVALALTGCGPINSAGSIPAPAGVVQAGGDRVVVEGGRALILANLSYQTVGTAAALAIENGWIAGPAKVRVQRASQKAVDALEAGQRALTTVDKASSAAAAFSAIDELCAIHPFIKSACERVK